MDLYDVLDKLSPDAMGWVGPWDTPEVVLAETQCLSPLPWTLGLIDNPWELPVEMAEVSLDMVKVLSIVMTGPLVDMVRVSAEMEVASVKISWVATQQTTSSPLEMEGILRRGWASTVEMAETTSLSDILPVAAWNIEKD